MRLNELRRNPEQNPKESMVDILAKYKDDPDVYVTFTELEKVGVNPGSTWPTPNGIYTYPLKETFDKFENRKAMFAAGAPYLHVLRGKVDVDINEYNPANLQRDINVLLKKAYSIAGDEKYKDNLIRMFQGFILGSPQNAKVPMEPLWNFTNKLAAYLSKLTNKESQNIWSALLRSMGYNGISDKHGTGTIHYAIPTQAVFLTKASVQVIDKLYNDKTSPLVRKQTLNKKSHKKLNKLYTIKDDKFIASPEYDYNMDEDRYAITKMEDNKRTEIGAAANKNNKWNIYLLHPETESYIDYGPSDSNSIQDAIEKLNNFYNIEKEEQLKQNQAKEKFLANQQEAKRRYREKMRAKNKT